MKKFGFTLAEVLITLGVIGIVAAITIPNIMTGYQKKVQVAALERAYNEVQNGIVKYMADNGIEKLSESGLSRNASNVLSFINTYLKPVQYSTNAYDFFNSNYLNISSQYNGYHNPTNSSFPGNSWTGTRYCAKLRSGASMCMSYYEPNYGYMAIIVDTNGKDKPNIQGRDFFAFNIYNDGTVATSNSSFYNHGSYSCDNPVNCFTKILNDGWEMNY